MSEFKSQITGLVLAIATAIGCIFYEKIVVNFSYHTMLILYTCIELPLIFIIGYFYFDNDVKSDYYKFISEPKYILYTLAWAATGITSICWFAVTKNQGIMVGSIYEVKYIVIMALIYIGFGENKFTLNTALGIALALGSIYFISKK